MTRRFRPSLKSVRVRLALWNVGVLALVLVVVGVVFSLSMRANNGRAVDQRLAWRGHHQQGHFANLPADLTAYILSGQDPHLYRRPGWGGPNLTPPSAPNPSPARDDSAFGELPQRMSDTQGRALPTGSDTLWDPTGFRRALNGEESYATIQSGGSVIRVFSVPLRNRIGKIVAVAQCGNSMSHFQAEEIRTTRTLLTLIPLVLIVAGLGGAFLTDRALRPVRGLAHEAGKIEAGNLSQRLPITGDDEFAELAETFNGMLARLQVAFESQEEAFEQQRRFTADASHELRTPLTIIKANTSLALSGTRTAPELLKTVQTVNTAADRMTRIVQDLLLLARSDAGQLTYDLIPTPLAGVVHEALGAVQGPDRAPVTVALKPEHLAVIGNADALVRLFSNLLENAARYTPPEGRITVSAETLGDVVSVKVTDTGEGIAPEHLPHLTERFYRVEASRSRPRGGTGLGLAICCSIVEAHGGELSIESVPGRGTTVRVTLPLTDEVPLLSRAEEPAVLVRA